MIRNGWIPNIVEKDKVVFQATWQRYIKVSWFKTVLYFHEKHTLGCPWPNLYRNQHQQTANMLSLVGWEWVIIQPIWKDHIQGDILNSQIDESNACKWDAHINCKLKELMSQSTTTWPTWNEYLRISLYLQYHRKLRNPTTYFIKDLDKLPFVMNSG